MPLSAQQKLELLLRAKDHWLEAESTALAYERALVSAKQYSEWLKIGTIVAALLTTGSGFAQQFSITVVTGLLTTLLATAEKIYSPTENHQKFWGCRTELFGVKENLATFSITLDVIDDLMKGAQPLTQFAQLIIATTQKMPVTLTDDDRRKARRSFQLTVIARIIDRVEIEVGLGKETELETTVELPEDAPDVIPAYRPRMQKAGGI